MTITIPMLLFWFLVVFTLVCLVSLVAIAQTPMARRWYVFFLISYVLWQWGIFAQESRPGLITELGLPLVWLVGTLTTGLPNISRPAVFPPQTGEPSITNTQERMGGRPGTLQALQLYFGLIVLGLVFAAVFFHFNYFPAYRIGWF